MRGGAEVPPAEPGRTVASAEGRAFVALVRELIQQLAVLVRNSSLHELTNETFVEPLQKAQAVLERILKGEGGLRLERSGQELFANGVRIRMELQTLHSYKYLLEELGKRDLGGLGFEGSASGDALWGLLRAMAGVRTTSGDGLAVMNRRLAEEGAVGIAALPPRVEPAGGKPDEAAPDRRERAIHAYQQALDFIRDSMSTLDSPAQLNTRRAKRAVHQLVDLSYEEGDGFSLAALAAIKQHHGYTFNHIVNVCVLAIAFGQRLGFPRAELARLGLSALYHDMGKLHIPLEILDAAAGLSEQAWAVMGNHTVYAARTLFPLIQQDPGAIDLILTALQHHHGYRGGGYPKLRICRRQHLFARITAIVDTFDAMTTKRLYQKRYLPDEAIAVIQKGAGTRYDPLLVKAFINCMGIYPVGSAVLLRTGEIGVVVASNPAPEKVHQPVVKRVADAAQRAAEVLLLDLSQPEHAGRSVVKCVDPEAYGLNPAHFVV